MIVLVLGGPMNSSAKIIFALCTLSLTLTPQVVTAKEDATAKKFYFEVRGVQVPSGSMPLLKEKAQAILLAELQKQPTVVTNLGSPSAQGAELEKRLQAQNLQGYALVLRIAKSAHSLQPPPPGKVYKVLMVEVSVAIDAEKIPSGQMALAGEGSANVGTEVRQIKDKEKLQLTLEALTEAIHQAVTQSITKLSAADKPAAKRRPTKRRKKG